MNGPKERLIELRLIEDVSIGCDQLSAILECIRSSCTADRVETALGGAALLATTLAEKLDRLVQT